MPTVSINTDYTTTNSTDSINVSGSVQNQAYLHIQNNSPPASAGCNESEKHDNDEKALFHGLKQGYRMSRHYDGTEYGSEDPQYEAAARSAAWTAIAYLKASDQDYTREDSFEYIEEKFIEDSGVLDRLLSVFRGETDDDGPGTLTNGEFSDAIDHAWTQCDDKEHHYDAARTALSAAEAFLGEQLWS